jgi:hypothetical protein
MQSFPSRIFCYLQENSPSEHKLYFKPARDATPVSLHSDRGGLAGSTLRASSSGLALIDTFFIYRLRSNVCPLSLSGFCSTPVHTYHNFFKQPMT